MEVKMKKLSYYIITCLSLILIFGCSSPNEKANKLYVEASQLVKKAQEVEKKSYSDALKLYKKALGKIERIQSKYPSSELAVKLVQDRIKVGSYTIKEIKETIVPHIEIKAKAEENPLACALFVAKTIKDADDKSWALADIAAQYAKAGQMNKASEILSQALQVAKTIKDADDKSWALTGIAAQYAKAGQMNKASEILSQALQVAKTIKHAYSKSMALADIAAQYAKAGQMNKASEILSQALQVAKTIKDAYYKSMALTDIAAQYAKAGQMNKTSEILSQALQVAKTIKHAYSKSGALIDIAGEYAKARQRVDDKAKKILHEIVLTSSKPENPIVGKWREIGGTETIEFFKDGTVIVFSKGMTMGGSYKFVAKDRIKLELGGLGILAGPIVAKVSINGDELTFITSDGDVSKYKRLK